MTATTTPSPAGGVAVVCVAPNGARRDKADHPSLPLSVCEVAETAAACAAAGAQVLHLHVRDAEGRHTLDATTYRKAVSAVRASAGDELMVQVTTEAVGRFTPAQQMRVVLDLRPQAVSLAVREIVPDAASEAMAAAFLERTFADGTGLQFIAYDRADAVRLVDLARRGVVPSDGRRRPHALFVLGRYTADQCGTPDDLLPFLAVWPSEWPWTVCAFGSAEATCLAFALACGGHVRVGFENNCLRPDGTAATDNAEQVAHVCTLVAAAGRRLASREEAGQVYGVDVARLLAYGPSHTEETHR